MTKRVLFVDAVNWSDQYDPAHPLRNVGKWFTRHVPADSGITPQVIRADDVFARNPEELKRVPDNVDALILSGSPRDAWSKEDPVNELLCELVLDCRDRGLPFLGVCYGHQILGRALGAKVDRNPNGWEVGRCEVTLTEAGRSHPLFQGVPEKLPVLQSHLDAVMELPPGCVALATSENTAQQSFHWNDQLYGVQFHPEMDPDVLRYLWGPRRDLWRDKVAFGLDQALDEMQPATHSHQVLVNFLLWNYADLQR